MLNLAQTTFVVDLSFINDLYLSMWKPNEIVETFSDTLKPQKLEKLPDSSKKKKKKALLTSQHEYRRLARREVFMSHPCERYFHILEDNRQQNSIVQMR